MARSKGVSKEIRPRTFGEERDKVIESTTKDIEKRFGKGRYFLFTGREFPGATKEGREAYRALVRRLAGEVKQSATISSETEGETDAICFSVFDRHAYFLNMDCRRARTFDYVLDGKAGTMTLEPCEIRVVPRKK